MNVTSVQQSEDQLISEARLAMSRCNWIVGESSDLSSYPPQQALIWQSTDMREWPTRHCDTDSDGLPEFRTWDQDLDTS